MDEKSAGYQKQETNLDHYKEEILEKCLWNLAVVKGKPKRCNCTNCSDCEFCKDQPIKCHKRATEWLKQLYKAPTLKHAAKAMLRDFVRQVVNLSESLEAAEIEDKED